MKRHKGPEIVIIITIILAFANFLLYDHSAIAITDVTLEEYDNTNDTYNLSYYLRAGRTYNLLDCEYTLYDKQGIAIYNDSSILEKIYSGSHTIHKNIIINTSTYSLNDIKKIDIKVYDGKINPEENNSNETPKHPIYNKTVNLTS